MSPVTPDLQQSLWLVKNKKLNTKGPINRERSKPKKLTMRKGEISRERSEQNFVFTTFTGTSLSLVLKRNYVNFFCEKVHIISRGATSAARSVALGLACKK